MVEVKRPRGDTVERVLRLLDDEMVLVSFQRRALEEARALRPGSARSSTSASASRSAAPRAAWAAGFQNERVTPRGLAAAQALGLETTVYTVNDTARLLELRDLGVTGVFTDDPRRALALLRRLGPFAEVRQRFVAGQREQLNAFAGTCATTLAPTGNADARAVDMSAIKPPVIFRRVTGPRNVCDSTSAGERVRARRRAVARSLQLERLRPDQDQHALTVRPAARLRDPQPPPGVLDLPGCTVDDVRFEPVHRSDELGDERRLRRGVHLRRASPSARSRRRT